MTVVRAAAAVFKKQISHKTVLQPQKSSAFILILDDLYSDPIRRNRIGESIRSIFSFFLGWILMFWLSWVIFSRTGSELESRSSLIKPSRPAPTAAGAVDLSFATLSACVCVCVYRFKT